MSKRNSVLAAALFTGSFLVASVQGQTTWYVDDDASTGGDGLTWPTAYKHLQDALAAATDGDEIHVAGGTYKPDQDEGGNVTPGDRTETFQLITGVAIYGGYRGCPEGNCGGGDPDERDLALYETILSGDLLGNDEPDFVNNDENSYHVVTGTGTDETAILDAFTITAGNADSSYPDNHGGGMFSVSGSPTVHNCTLKSNRAYQGGGMYNEGSYPRVVNCAFTGNWGNFGGGMENQSGSYPTVTNCMFYGNDGSGMANYSSQPIVVNCTFTGNTGAGVSNADWTDAWLANCTFSGNYRGVGTACEVGGHWANAHLRNCVLWGDTSGEIVNGMGAVTTVIYSDVEDSYPGEGNIDEDPRFVDPDGPDDIVGTADDDLRLLLGSPCVDTGDPDYDPGPDATDLDGNPRIVDGDFDGTPTVDMGAYEHQGDQPIPTVSEWGLVAMTLLLLAAATLVFVRRRQVA